jgi:DNA-binding HxlR family transcriptional regulator/putative sterol carrier protein
MRCYGQYCPVAHSLDLVGERWALLIVRDLLHGPKRYTDLLASLGGISTNMLASRLRDLEEGDVVRKTRLPPPAASTVYELTEYGAELGEVLYALGRWGARSLGPPEPTDALPADWLQNAVRATFDPNAAGGVHATYELRAGDERALIRVDDGALTDADAESEPDLVVETDAPTLFRLVARELDPEAALAQGLVRVEGDRAALARFVSVFSLEPRAPALAS